jgi:hypothetical protein
MVAWQFTARNAPKKRTRPAGNGVIGARGTFYDLVSIVIVIALTFLLYRFADTPLKIVSNVVLALMIVSGVC